MKHDFLFNQRQRFSIRTFTLGTASVLIGCALFAGTLVQAEETVSAGMEHVEGESSGMTEESLPISTEEENVLTAEEAVAAPRSSTTVDATEAVEATEEATIHLSEASTETAAVDYTRRSTHLGAVTSVEVDRDKKNVFHVTYETGQKGKISFYNDHVIRYHVVDGNGEFKEMPDPSRADRPASIVEKTLDQYPAGLVPSLSVDDKRYTIETEKVALHLNKEHSLLTIIDRLSNKAVIQEVEPLDFAGNKSKQTLASSETSQYFGGGTQNGRFTHKGEVIKIVNENRWTDKGVASPNPFYWTNEGYGVLRHTFKPGQYDFENKEAGKVITSHDDKNFDTFYFINQQPAAILKDYYDLTGNPVVLPIFALYEGHLNAYNRDYWVEVPANTPGAVYFDEVKKWYKEYQPSALGNREGILETLNGNKNDANYPFTASAVVDRYARHDMPLGWILVNDGYGAGYGQTDSLKGNIENLKKFSDYAKSKGVLTGLWTQSDLHPDPKQPPLLQRDLSSEVRDAMVRILKTDVAWVGPGYSFGLNGISEAANIMKTEGNNARPFIITLDGWGGTQRYGGIWTGDQTGGQWEYIRFHIPTYIGTGLSGNPNVGSDMDGIFGGGDRVINVRDHQWKVFTTLMLQMDGWGRNPKTPFSFDTEASDINRTYLKMKSALVPYSYSVGHEAATGKPIVRAMFLEFPNEPINYSKAVQYQFMYGENFLIAPIYESVKGQASGHDVRNGIYLPQGAEWIDYFTGEIYKGGQMLNNFDSPLWKLPIFVKNGAIIPITKEHNNYTEIDHGLRQVDFYPHGNTEFTLVEDDGLTVDYLKEKVAKTRITSKVAGQHATLTMEKTRSQYDQFIKNKAAQFNVNVSRKPESVRLFIGDQEVSLTKVDSLEAFEAGENVYFYDEAPDLNRFATAGGSLASVKMVKNPVLRVKSAKFDVTQKEARLELTGFENQKLAQKEILSEAGLAPTASIVANRITPTSIDVTWTAVEGADSYDVEADGVLNTNVTTATFHHAGLGYGSRHQYRVRARKGTTATPWSAMIEAMTEANPLVNAIDNIAISSNRNAQSGTPHSHLVDKDTSTMYHSKWSETSVPEWLQLDLKQVYELDKLEYVPRPDGINGIITSSKLYFSVDGNHWKSFTDSIRWDANQDTKTFPFPNGVKARYLALLVEKTMGGNKFVSGQELLVYKKVGTSGNVVGDVTGDGYIDDNDVTSLNNYAGLRRGIDPDFEGYVEVADLNGNNVIDAYDTYYVTRQLGEGQNKAAVPASGQLNWVAEKTNLAEGETVTLRLQGKDLHQVEAIYAHVPIEADKFEIVSDVSVDASLANMMNFSRVRTHGDGSKEAFVILSNQKTAPAVEGNHTIATVTLRSRKAQMLALPEMTRFIVGSDLRIVEGEARPDETENQTNTKMVEASRIQVSGESVYQNGRPLTNLLDNNPDTLSELKWDYSANHVNGKLPDEITLPQDIRFDFDKSQPTLLESVLIRKRTPGNGTVTKYKLTAYRGEEAVYTSDEQSFAFDEAEVRHRLDKVRQVDRVVLTILEARTNPTTVNNRMMTLKDVLFYEQPTALQPKAVEGTLLEARGQDVYQDGRGVEKLLDNDPTSLTELKWDWEPNHVNGQLPAAVTLPQDIQLMTKSGDVLYLTGLEVHKRTPGNGTVTKYKVTAYQGDKKVYESEEVETPFAEEKSTLNFGQIVAANKVILTVLEARTNPTTVNNRMMTLKDVHLLAVDSDLLPVELLIEKPTQPIEERDAVPDTAPMVDELPIAEFDLLPDAAPVADDLPVAPFDVVPAVAPVAEDLPIASLVSEQQEPSMVMAGAALTPMGNQTALPSTGTEEAIASLLGLTIVLGLGLHHAAKRKEDSLV